MAQFLCSRNVQARGYVARAHIGKSGDCGVVWCGSRSQCISTGVADKGAGREWALFDVDERGELTERARGQIDNGAKKTGETFVDA